MSGQTTAIVECLTALGRLPPDEQLGALAAVIRVAISREDNPDIKRLQEMHGIKIGTTKRTKQ